MQRRERDLRGADEEQLVVGEPVDLLLGVGQEARAEERLLAHEHRRDHRLEALRAQALERPAHERELEQHEIALEVGEPRAGEARARLHVDQRAGELEVVGCGAAARLADRTDHGVGVGRIGARQVRQGAQRGRQLGVDRRKLLLELLLTLAGLAHPRDRVRRVRAGPLGGGDRLRRLVLGGTQRLELREAPRAGARRARAPDRRAPPPPRLAAPAPRERRQVARGSA